MPRPTRLLWRSDLGWPAHSPASRANPKKGLVIHYDSQDQGLADQDHSACVDYWNWCRDFHTNSRGWADVGYSFMACPHGYVMEGRGLYRYQAAQGTTSGNSNYYSVTLASGPSDPIPQLQIDAVRELRQWLMEPSTSIHGTVLGHRDFKSTSCPGNRAYKLVKDGTFAQPPGTSIPPDDGGSDGSDTKAPKFPLPRGWAFGPRTGPTWQVSGYYSHREDLRRWQRRMLERGWSGLGAADGLYGPKTEKVTKQFQREKSLTVDGLIGIRTWNAAWEAPIT